MIISPNEQRSEAWFSERAGLPTASNFHKIVTSKGEPSDQRKKYMRTLAGEKITGEQDKSYKNDDMIRGTEMEEPAISLYEFATGNKVELVGLCWKDEEKTVGASPDALVGSDGGLEVKSACHSIQVERLLANKLPAGKVQQLQGCMFVTGRKWWDFMSFRLKMRPLIIRVERNEEFINRLSTELDKFCKELNEIVNKIR